MRSIVRVGIGLLTAVALAACSGTATPAPPTAGPATAAPGTAAPPSTAADAPCIDVTDTGAATTVDASVEGFEWTPSTVTAKVGDVITWTNGDSAPHGVGLEDGSCRMTSNMGGGQSRSLQFSRAGEFKFACRVHPDMKGTFVITE